MTASDREIERLLTSGNQASTPTQQAGGQTVPDNKVDDRSDVLKALMEQTHNLFDVSSGEVFVDVSKANETVVPEWMRRKGSIFPDAKETDTVGHLVATASKEKIEEIRRRLQRADIEPPSFAPRYVFNRSQTPHSAQQESAPVAGNSKRGETSGPPSVPEDRRDVLEVLLDQTQNLVEPTRGIRTGDSKTNGTLAPAWMMEPESVFPDGREGDTVEHLVATATNAKIEEIRALLKEAKAHMPDFKPPRPTAIILASAARASAPVQRAGGQNDDRSDVVKDLVDLTQDPFDPNRGIRSGDSKTNGLLRRNG